MPIWLKDVRPRFTRFVTVPLVQAFANRAYELLKKKAAGEPISSEVEALLAPGRSTPSDPPGSLFIDDGKHVKMNESREFFWAIEFELLLRDLQKPEHDGEDDWLSVVDSCPQCGNFFVKQRKDQIFDTSSCRTKFANKYVPRSRRGSRRH